MRTTGLTTAVLISGPASYRLTADAAIVPVAAIARGERRDERRAPPHGQTYKLSPSATGSIPAALRRATPCSPVSALLATKYTYAPSSEICTTPCTAAPSPVLSVVPPVRSFSVPGGQIVFIEVRTVPVRAGIRVFGQLRVTREEHASTRRRSHPNTARLDPGWVCTADAATADTSTVHASTATVHSPPAFSATSPLTNRRLGERQLSGFLARDSRPRRDPITRDPLPHHKRRRAVPRDTALRRLVGNGRLGERENVPGDRRDLGPGAKGGTREERTDSELRPRNILSISLAPTGSSLIRIPAAADKRADHIRTSGQRTRATRFRFRDRALRLPDIHPHKQLRRHPVLLRMLGLVKYTRDPSADTACHKSFLGPTASSGRLADAPFIDSPSLLTLTGTRRSRPLHSELREHHPAEIARRTQSKGPSLLRRHIFIGLPPQIREIQTIFAFFFPTGCAFDERGVRAREPLPQFRRERIPFIRRPQFCLDGVEQRRDALRRPAIRSAPREKLVFRVRRPWGPANDPSREYVTASPDTAARGPAWRRVGRVLPARLRRGDHLIRAAVGELQPEGLFGAAAVRWGSSPIVRSPGRVAS